MKKLMRALLVVAILGILSFLGIYIGSHNMGVLNPKGAIAIAEKNLLITSVYLMLIVIIPVFIMLFSFAWRYRAGNTKAKYDPSWHTSVVLEVILWAIPIAIVTVLGTITWTSSHELDPSKELNSSVKPVIVQVVALDWKWLFIYPEEHIGTVNFLELPKDTPVKFYITSDAPMNAFWIPQLGSQIYAMAGMSAQLNLIAHEEGVYKGVSSNFSGDGFSGMKFDTKVVSGEEYVAWLNTIRKSSSSLTEKEYTQLSRQTKNHPVVFYASVKDDLYTSIIMKYMTPSGRMDTNSALPSHTMEMDHMHSH